MIYLKENDEITIDLKKKKVFLFDMDGTIYIDDQVIHGAVDFIQYLKSNGYKRYFFTNNSSKTREEYFHKLRGFGIDLHEEEIITSNRITADYLKENHSAAKILYMGNFEATKEIKSFGLNIIPPYKRNMDKKIDIAVMAYDTGINYEKIVVFSHFLKKNVLYIVTHPDINCPSETGMLPDVGAFISMFKSSTGRDPDLIMGKPSAHILNYIIEKEQINKQEAIFIGDRVYTDIKMAKDTDISSILVLSGESELSDVEKYNYSPDLIVDSLLDLYDVFKGEN